MNIVNIIQQIVQNSMDSSQLTDITFGVVTSIDPLKIKLMDSKMELGESNLVLTESVIRKEITITSHIHYFEKNLFKHNHGSPLTGEKGQVSIVVGGQGTFVPAGSKVELDKGSLDKDLTAEEEDIQTLENREPTKSTLKVKVNGKIIPLSKDPDGEKEPDTEETDVYWGLINEGLKVDDGVVLLSVKRGQLYIILSKFYESYHYREDEE